jgi:hypothetical protein
MNYEQLPKKQYYKEHDLHEEAGLAIPDGEEVVPTEWCYQNGVINRDDTRVYIKTHTINHRNGEKGIWVERANGKGGGAYWPGFWKIKK